MGHALWDECVSLPTCPPLDPSLNEEPSSKLFDAVAPRRRAVTGHLQLSCSSLLPELAWLCHSTVWDVVCSSLRSVSDAQARVTVRVVLTVNPGYTPGLIRKSRS